MSVVRLSTPRRLRRRPLQVEPLEGRALLASLLAGPLSATLAPALVGVASASSPVTMSAYSTRESLQVSLSIRINPANVQVTQLLQGIRDLYQGIDALVSAPGPIDSLRKAVEDALAEITQATGAPQARPVQDLTSAVNGVASTGKLTQAQQSQIQSSVATILAQSGLESVVVLPALQASPILNPGVSPLTYDPTRLTGPYAEALAPYRETRGQSEPQAATLSSSVNGPASTLADPDTTGHLLDSLTDVLKPSQAAADRKVAFVDTLAEVARDLPARPDFALVTQLRATVGGLTPAALQAGPARSALGRQLQATVQSTGLPPARADELTAGTLEIATAPGLDAPALQALFEAVLAVLNGQLPTAPGWQ